MFFGIIDIWLVWKLIDGFVYVIDYLNVVCMMFYNIKEFKWDDEILELLNIFKVMLLEVKFNFEVYGKIILFYFYGGEVLIFGMVGD